MMQTHLNIEHVEMNKDYYSDNELKPTEEIFLSISIVPLTTLRTPNVR